MLFNILTIKIMACEMDWIESRERMKHSPCCDAPMQVRGTHLKDWILQDGDVIKDGIYDEWGMFCTKCNNKIL